MSHPLIIALPKGRILKEVMPLIHATGLEAEDAFFDEKSRQLTFNTNEKDIKIIRVRAFDAATFAAFGAAHLAVVGDDVLAEFDYSDLYSPLDLDIGHCRLALAAPEDMDSDNFNGLSHIRIATKYPNITSRYFARKGIQAECVKLNGAMEIAPNLGLCNYIVDLVSSGATLKANRLKEITTLQTITSRLVINRTAFKTRAKQMNEWINRFQEALNAPNS